MGREHRKQNDRTICTKTQQVLHSQPGLSQGKSHFPFGLCSFSFFLEKYFTLMLKNQRVFRAVYQWSLIWKLHQLWNHRFCSFKTKENKQKNPHLFSHKNKLRVFGYDSKCSCYTRLSEPPWLGAAAGALPELQPQTQNPEWLQPGWLGKALPGHLPRAQTQTKHWTLGPVPQPSVGKGTAAGLSVSQCFNPALLVQISAWSSESYHPMTVLPPCMGHKPPKQMHNTGTNLHPGSRRNLRKFHSKPINLPGPWLAPESAPFWLLLAQECRQESVCKVYWPD